MLSKEVSGIAKIHSQTDSQGVGWEKATSKPPVNPEAGADERVEHSLSLPNQEAWLIILKGRFAGSLSSSMEPESMNCDACLIPGAQ